MKASDKERVLVEVAQRVLDSVGAEPLVVEQVLFDTLYEERHRLETEKDRVKAAIEAAFYDRVMSEARHAEPEARRALLREVIQAFAEEVVGHFDPRVYALATRVVPPALTVTLNSLSPLRLAGGPSRFEEQCEVHGHVDLLQKVARLGTTVVVSTHSSNLDSIVLGHALHRMGLPPYTYGAGLNLFSNPVIGWFMHHLGAYRVDRRKKAELYKRVLKTYAGCTMEAGYHNMFFPGGTRSRSGAVEARLKMGLLGMGLDAYIHNLQAGRPQPDLFVVPCTLNYQLVLEAGTLIDDHLKEVGKSRYIIEDDEFSKPRVVLSFARQLFTLDSRIHVVVGRPMDVFGNVVDEEGRSLDRQGRKVDRRRYVERKGQVVLDPQRDEEYTRELSLAVVDAFHRDTLLQSTNLVCRAVFDLLKARNPGMDLYRLLRTGGSDPSLPLTEVYGSLGRVLTMVRRWADQGQVQLDARVRERDPVALLADALSHFAGFHERAAIVREGDRLVARDRNLILYYQNRLSGFGRSR